MAINVNKTVTDEFYRYKMPPILAKVEGKGNGIKTVLVNMAEVSKALNRPPLYATKYFGCELGAQTQLDKDDRYIVNGSHDAGKLQNLLHDFIAKYVLCSQCNNPETKLDVKGKKKNAMIYQRCLACGTVITIDTASRVSQYILKNPPPQDTEPNHKTASPKREKSDNEKKSDTEKEGESLFPPPEADSGNDSDASWGDPVESVDNSAALNELTMPEKERIHKFYDFVKELSSTEKRAVDNEMIRTILDESNRLRVPEKKAVLVLAELFFTENIIAEAQSYRLLFLCFTSKKKEAQDYLLGAVEQLLQKYEGLLPKAPHVLKALYDQDLLEEEQLLKWEKKVSKKFVKKEFALKIRKKAEPFLDWLKNAEEESSEEEEDDEEDEAEQDEPVPPADGVPEKKREPVVVNGKREQSADEDELNIDDI